MISSKKPNKITDYGLENTLDAYLDLAHEAISD